MSQPRRPLAADPRRRRPGFSLMEMLVVLVILGLLFGLVGPRVLAYLSSAKTKTAEIQIRNLSTAVELFAIDIGRFPTETEGLSALTEQPLGVVGWAGPYLSEATPSDPWGAPYLYALGEGSKPFTIRSLGADQAPGGDGDAADVSN